MVRRKFSTVRIIWLLMITLAATGCGGSSSSSSPAGTQGASSNPTILSLSSLTPSGLTVSVAQSKAALPVGGQEIYTLHLTNTTSNPITIETALDANGVPLIPVNFKVVQNSTGSVIYSFDPLAAQPAPTQVQQVIEPGAGNALTATITLTGEMRAAGPYSATGTFTINGASTTVGPLVVTAQ